MNAMSVMQRGRQWLFRHGLRGALRCLRVSTGVPLAAVIVLTSCNTEAMVETNPVASVELTPPTATVATGGTIALTARPLNADGDPVAVRTISWSSSDSRIAAVSSTGVVTALAPGEVRIAASALGRSATATITIAAPDVASVTVSPPTVSMRVGVTTSLQAVPRDASGTPLAGRAVAWASTSPTVASVSAQGVVTALTPGASIITATSEGRTGQAAVTVTAPPVQTVTVARAVDTIGVGSQVAKTAVLRDDAGLVLTGRALSWSSSNVAIATVSSTGVVIGLSPGTVTISAISEGRVGTASVVVLARLASAVILSPASTTLIVGVTQQLTAQITDAQGNLLTGRPISYASDAPAIATVSSTGLVSAVAPGTARITATSEGRTGNATVQVVPIPVASVQVTPTTASLITGATRQLTVVVRSASGAVLTGRPVTWTSGSPGIASISASGLVTAISPGVTVMLATVEGVTALSTVTVSLPVIASISLTPAAPSIAVLASVQLSAVPRDGAGNALTGRVITWTSSDESVAFVSSTGQVVGFKVGTALITATSEGVSASTTVTVR